MIFAKIKNPIETTTRVFKPIFPLGQRYLLNVRNVLKRVIIKKIDLKKGYIFKKNKIYLVKINEKLNLPKNIFGKCNPKSSTGRLDIFCRTILDYSDEYEKIPLNYRGEIFLEVTSRSFDIKFQRGNSLNQMRLVLN